MRTSLWSSLALAVAVAFAAPYPSEAQIDVISVDITPLVSPGPDFFGHLQNTMGMALQAVDQGGDFNVTEVTPAAFSLMTQAQLSQFDLIALNNSPPRIAGGIGATWQSVVGINSGGRVVLCSHDAVRFHMNQQPNDFGFGSGPPACAAGQEPFGAPDLIRQAALWAGGGGRTGLLIFNDAPSFVGGAGWDNGELNLPGVWGISDLHQADLGDGGFADILAGFQAHPIYAGLSDVRFDVNSISSFSANLGDISYHSVFRSFNPGIFTVTEAIINAGQTDVGGCGCCTFGTVPGPDGTAITLIRDEERGAGLDIKPGSCPNPLNPVSQGILPVALLGSDEFDVNLVDVSSLQLEGVSPVRSRVADVASPVDDGEECECTEEGADGLADLTLKFRTQDIVSALGPATRDQVLVLTLTGTLLDGTPFEASDCMVIRGNPDQGIVGQDQETVISWSLDYDGSGSAVHVSYVLSEETPTQLNVYDVAGRLVKRLVNAVQPAGRHTVVWDTIGTANGVYLLRIEVGDLAETRRIVVLR